jgi:hypothetical protein
MFHKAANFFLSNKPNTPDNNGCQGFYARRRLKQYFLNSPLLKYGSDVREY